MKQKILLTGANGLLGQKIISQITQLKNIDLYATSRGSNRNPNQDGYSYFPLELTDFDSLKQHIESIQPKVIIHAAAMTNVDQCELHPEQCALLNTKVTEVLCQISKPLESKICFVSTDFIFDGTSGPYREEDKAHPLSHYGNSKWDAEKIIVESGIPYLIARTILLYGYLADPQHRNIIYWMKSQLAAGKPINVVTDQFRAPTLAEDLAEGIIKLINARQEGIFHLSGPETISIFEMARRVADYYKWDKALVNPINSETLGQAAKRPPKTGFILDKAKKAIGYQPKKLEEGLELMDFQSKSN